MNISIVSSVFNHTESVLHSNYAYGYDLKNTVYKSDTWFWNYSISCEKGEYLLFFLRTKLYIEYFLLAVLQSWLHIREQFCIIHW